MSPEVNARPQKIALGEVVVKCKNKTKPGLKPMRNVLKCPRTGRYVLSQLYLNQRQSNWIPATIESAGEVKMARFCSSCGTQMADNATFCPSCGQSAVATTGGAPAPAVGQGSAAPASGLQDNVAGALAYLVIPAIIFLVVEPYNRNRFIRFHSFQAIIYWIASIILQTIAWMIPILNLVLGPIIGLAIFIGWVVLLIKAFQGTMFKMPMIGDLAEKQAGTM
jgi:uncharacterized membrane protein